MGSSWSREHRGADAEVVDRDPDTKLGERFDPRTEVLGPRGDGLGDLQLDERRIDACGTQLGPDLLGELGTDDIIARQVHSDSHEESGLAPPPRLSEPNGSDRLVDAGHETALFGDGEERGGAETSEPRMIPAHKTLDDPHAARRRVDLRLVEDGQLLLVERSVQVAFERQARLTRRHGARVQREPASSRSLRGVHGGVGMHEQAGRVGAVRW